MRRREQTQAGIIGGLVAAVVVTAVSLWAQNGNVTYRDALALGRPLDPEYGGVPAGAVIFVTTAACPTGYAEYATAQGRYVVGLPQNGTLAGTRGDPLANLHVRRGGTSHAGPSLSTISVSDDFAVSHTRPTVTYTRPTATYTRPTVSHTRPTVTYTRPTVTHVHTHTYHRVRVVASGMGTSIGQGSEVLRGDNPESAGVSATPVVSGGGVSLAGGGASLAGGGVSLSGGGVSISGGGASLSGGISLSGGQISGGSASNQPQPAPYVQLLACQRS